MIDPRTTLGAVELTVADLAATRRFYEQVMGLATVRRDGDRASLGAPDGPPLVELVERPDAPPRPRRAPGLFHLALLVPDRGALARAVRRVVEHGWRLTGASDHFVSEAVYLHDPEGNGIEIYRDRPREEWQHVDGELRMGTVALDLDAVMAAEPAGRDRGIEPGTCIGHVHLQVGDVPAAERFWHGELGFEVTVRSYAGALFLAAGGYHHHIGLNTWNSLGAGPVAPGALGLRRFTVLVPGAPAERELADPSGNPVRLAPA